MGVWAVLTEPSPALRSSHHRRQSRLMSAVLVCIVPVFAVMAVAAALTRPVALTRTDWVIGSLMGIASVVSYALNRSVRYQRGAVLLTTAAIVGAAVIGAREPDPVRAVFSALLSITGPLYASFLLSARSTLIAAVASLLTTIAALLFNPAVSHATAVLPLFFSGYALALTVVSAMLRERQVRELEGATALLRSTLDASRDAAIIVDRDGRITEWSLVAERLFGVAPAQAAGQPFSELVRGDISLIGPGRLDFNATRPDGSTFPCEGHVASLPDERAAVFLRDVSDRKQMEARLMMSDRLETMGRMVAGVAHEINNPLAYVSANLTFLASALQEEPLNKAEVQGVIAETHEGARRIQTIVQDLRIFSRSGEFEAVSVVHVETIIDSVLTIAQPRLREARAALKKDFGKVGTVWGIESRLAQVFLNLVVNAAQALPEAHENRDIVVATRREGSRVVVSVRDFGPGIPEEVRSRLFSPFFTTKPAGQGTGLGLYISQNIITGLKGELRVSNPGPGALFEVVLSAAE